MQWKRHRYRSVIGAGGRRAGSIWTLWPLTKTGIANSSRQQGLITEIS
jgi:hypothetical protein